MSKFSKKIVSLASSLLAFTSLAGSANAMQQDPYRFYDDISQHTLKNAIHADESAYDSFLASLSDDNKNFLRDNAYYVANRVANHPRTAGGVVGAAALLGGMKIAYDLGAFDGILGRNENNDNYDNDFDDFELEDDEYKFKRYY